MGKKSKEGRAIKTSPHPSALSARSGSATANKCFKARFRIAHWRCTRSYLSVITIHFLAVYSTYFLSAGIKLCQVLYFNNPKACLRSLLFQFIQISSWCYQDLYQQLWFVFLWSLFSKTWNASALSLFMDLELAVLSP